MTIERITRHNTRLAQWGLTSFIESLCIYCKFAQADNLVLQNPPLRQAWERYQQCWTTNRHKLLQYKLLARLGF